MGIVGLIDIGEDIKQQEAPFFLATTACEEFWDPTKPVVFLGEWCRRYSRRSYWEQLGDRVICSPWDNDQKTRNACRYVNQIYEHLLVHLTEALNLLHGVQHGERYWRIVIGPWLQPYITAIYDRYMSLNVAIERFPNFMTLGLSQSSFVIPSDTSEFLNYLKEDIYNLQIYTKILTALGKDFPKRPLKEDVLSPSSAVSNLSWKKRLLSSVSDAACKLIQNMGPVVLRSSCFPRSVQFKLSLKTAGTVLPFRKYVAKPYLFSMDKQARSRLKEISLGSGEFEKLLPGMVAEDIPYSFVEGFNVISEEAKKFYPSKPKVIFSPISWYYDETFKQWSASASERGAILVGAQHGGNYGSIVGMPAEEHELAITDYYCSWGWERLNCNAEVVPLPGARLLGRKMIGASNQRKGILWVTTTHSRYIYEVPFLSSARFSAYLNKHRRFITSLKPQILEKLRIRPHSKDWGWDLAERLKELVPELPVETGDTSFLESLDHCRLYVCDHLSTTFAEALSANKPTILFWNPETIKLRPESQPYYDSLQKGGILFETPEDAAAAIALVYDDVEGWWNEPSRQSIVKTFCHHFVRTSSNAVDQWADFFRRIARRHGGNDN